ncbi:hypothetical protein ACOMHN_005508 [Nucella lapillus]
MRVTLAMNSSVHLIVNVYHMVSRFNVWPGLNHGAERLKGRVTDRRGFKQRTLSPVRASAGRAIHVIHPSRAPHHPALRPLPAIYLPWVLF